MTYIAIYAKDKLIVDAIADLFVQHKGYRTTACHTAMEMNEAATSSPDLLLWLDNGGAQLHLPSLSLADKMPLRFAELCKHVEQSLAAKQEIVSLAITDDIALMINSRQLTCKKSGMQLDLTEKEAALLHFMASAKQATRETLLSQIWGMSAEADTHTLETHLYRLRQKWRQISAVELIVVTDGGYRWHDAI